MAPIKAPDERIPVSGANEPAGRNPVGGTGKAERRRTQGAARRLRRQAQRCPVKVGGKGSNDDGTSVIQADRQPALMESCTREINDACQLAPNDAVNPNGPRALLREEAVDAAGRPGRDATAEEVSVLSPDRTAESKGGCENRPVLRIACAKPLPRFGFEIAIEVQADQSPERSYGSQKRPMLSRDRRRVSPPS